VRSVTLTGVKEAAAAERLKLLLLVGTGTVVDVVNVLATAGFNTVVAVTIGE